MPVVSTLLSYCCHLVSNQLTPIKYFTMRRNVNDSPQNFAIHQLKGKLPCNKYNWNTDTLVSVFSLTSLSPLQSSEVTAPVPTAQGPLTTHSKTKGKPVSAFPIPDPSLILELSNPHGTVPGADHSSSPGSSPGSDPGTCNCSAADACFSRGIGPGSGTGANTGTCHLTNSSCISGPGYFLLFFQGLVCCHEKDLE